MAIIPCTECNNNISDLAQECVHCGAPVTPNRANNEIIPEENSQERVKKNLGAAKAGDLFVFLISYGFAVWVMGIDFVFVKNPNMADVILNPMGIASSPLFYIWSDIAQSGAKELYWGDKGILILVGDHWYGMAKIYEGKLNIPLLNGIVMVLVTLFGLRLLFWWKR